MPSRLHVLDSLPTTPNGKLDHAALSTMADSLAATTSDRSLTSTEVLVAAVVHSLAEITSSAAGWSLSFDLAPQERMGSYQGVYGTGYAVGAMIAPAVVTLTAIDLGTGGWAILAAMFAAAAAGVVVIARRAEREGDAAPTG